MHRLILFVCFLFLLPSSCRFVRTVSIAREAGKQIDEQHPDSVMEIPFVYKNDWIHLRLNVEQGSNSYEGFFLFDTGGFTELYDSCGPLTVITPDAMEMPIKGALGRTTVQMRVAERVTLELHQLRVKKSKVFVVRRPVMFPADCVGMIGADFFRNCIVQIDFQNDCLRVFPSEKFSRTTDVLQMSMVANHNPVVSRLVIAGMEPEAYLFDLGSQQSIFIQKDNEDELRKVMDDSVLAYAISSSRDVAKDASGQTIRSNYYVRYGKTFNDDTCAEFEIGGIINPENAFRKSNLGLGFARRIFSSVTLDMPRRLFYYQIKNENPTIDRLSRDIYFKHEDSTFLTGPILTTSCWYQQGVRPGQKVVRINGESPYDFMEARKTGREISVTSLTIQTREGERQLSRIP